MTAATAREKQRRLEPQSISEKLLHWLFFGVVMALVPFIAAIFSDVDRDKAFSFPSLFGHGDLLIIATIISAGGIGDLFGTAVDKRHRTPKLIVLGCSIVSVAVTCMWFGDISSLLFTTHPADPMTVAVGSLILFAFAIIEGISALMLSES